MLYAYLNKHVKLKVQVSIKYVKYGISYLNSEFERKSYDNSNNVQGY